MKTSISKKASWFMIVTIGIVATCLLIIGFISVWKMRFDTIGSRQKQDAQIFSDFIAHQIDYQVDDIRAYVNSPWWIDAVKEANLRYENWEPKAIQEHMAHMDKQWPAMADSQLQEWLGSRLGQRLKILAKRDEVIAEIFLTDQYGGLVAASGKTSDFYQADELWWQRAYNNGKGDIYFGEVELDESSGIISSAIAVPVSDESGRIIGIAKAALDVGVFFDAMKLYKFGKTGHSALVDEQGKVIYYAGLKPMSVSPLSRVIIEELLGGKHDFMVINPGSPEGRSLLAAAKIKSQYLESNGIHWVSVISQEVGEIFLPLYRIFGIGVILALAISFLVITIMQSSIKGIFISPLQKIRDGMQRFSAGEHDYKIDLKTGDEIEDLADAFNKMTGQLDKTTVSKDYLDNIMTSMTDSLVVVSPEAKITTVNKATCALLGYEEKELIGEDVSLLFSEEEEEEEIPLTGTKLKKLLKEGILRNYEINYRAKDGHKIPVILSGAVLKRQDCAHGGPRDDCPSFKEKGKHCEKILGAVCVAKDITEQKKAREMLQKSEEQFRALFDSSRDAIMIIEPPSWKFTSGNRATVEMFRAKKEDEFISFGPWTLSPERQPDGSASSEKSKEMIEMAMRDGSSFFEWTHKRLNGEEFPAIVLLTRVEYAGKKVLQATVRDISIQKQAESILKKQSLELEASLKEAHKSREILSSMLADNNEIRERLEESLEKLKETQAQLIHAEKMEAVGRMASGVAHEVKNPLAIILQGINYFEGGLPPEEKDNREMLGMMKDSVKRADSIVRALLDFSRAQELELEPQDINVVIENSINLVRHSLTLKSIEPVREPGKDLPKLLIDPGKVEQVFVNLFNNAADAMPKGGKLYIRSYLSELKEPKNKIGNREDDIFRLGEKAIIVEVEDTGVGIGEDIITKIFDPFFSTKDRTEGTGLGLSVTKSIVEMHKGLIYVESKKGKGTKFTIVFKIPEKGRC